MTRISTLFCLRLCERTFLGVFFFMQDCKSNMKGSPGMALYPFSLARVNGESTGEEVVTLAAATANANPF